MFRLLDRHTARALSVSSRCCERASLPLVSHCVLTLMRNLCSVAATVLAIYVPLFLQVSAWFLFVIGCFNFALVRPTTTESGRA